MRSTRGPSGTLRLLIATPTRERINTRRQSAIAFLARREKTTFRIQKLTTSNAPQLHANHRKPAFSGNRRDKRRNALHVATKRRRTAKLADLNAAKNQRGPTRQTHGHRLAVNTRKIAHDIDKHRALTTRRLNARADDS